MDAFFARGPSFAMRYRLALAVCLVVGLSAVACRGKTWRPPLKALMAPWVGNSALYAAQTHKRFAPLDVRVIALSTDFDAWRALIERRADMFAGTVFDAVRAVDGGADLRIVTALDFSNGADGIIAREGISDLASLKGKKVAVERCTTTHFVLLRALDRVGIHEEDIILENYATDAALKALDEGRVDAAALWEPYLSKAKKPGRRILFTSAEIPGEVIDVLGVRADLARDRPEDIKNIVRGIHIEAELFRTDRDYGVKTLMAENQIAKDVAEESLRMVHFITAEENRALFERANSGATLWKAYELAADFLKKHKMLRHPIRPAKDVLGVETMDSEMGPKL